MLSYAMEVKQEFIALAISLSSLVSSFLSTIRLLILFFSFSLGRIKLVAFQKLRGFGLQSCNLSVK